MRQLKITQSVTSRTSKAVEKYLSDISKLPLITSQREIELAPKIRQGDENALQELVNANLRFVVSVAKQYQNRGVELLDLINEGNVGLIKAARKFDETRGFKFISFAVWWIRQSILQHIADNGRIIRLPLNKIGLQNKFLKVHSALEQKLSRQPSDEEVMEEMGLSEKEVRDLVQTMKKIQSYDAELTNEEGSATLLDVLKPSEGDTNSPDEPLMISESMKIDIERTLSTLKNNERQIVELFFGLGGNRTHSLEEIGEKFELTRERVRQIKEAGVRRLRIHSRSNLLRKYLN
jgi:RNA polymerase primary sigma factor